MCRGGRYSFPWIESSSSSQFERVLSTPTASRFVADKADARQGGRVATVVAEGLLKTWWHSVAVLFLHLLCLRAALRVFLKDETMCLVVRHQESRFSTQVDLQPWSIWQVHRNCFKKSLKRFFDATLLRYLARRSPHNMILNRRCFLALETLPAQRSRDVNYMASMHP